MTSEPPPLTENSLVNAIIARQFMRSFVLPRFTPINWWECDCFEITGAGFFREFEVKLTVADFRADRTKKKEIRKSGRWEDDPSPAHPGGKKYVCDYETKHELLARGDPRGPTQFFYVVPQGLLKDEPIPSFAGVFEAVQRPAGSDWYFPSLIQLVAAPKLHKQVADPKSVAYARANVYHRYHNVRAQKIPNAADMTDPIFIP